MYLVEILLPVYDNQRRPFGREPFDRVRDELVERFGGVTAFRRSPAEGVWQEGGENNYDEVVIYQVMTEILDRDWWGEYRRELEQHFRQDQIVVRATSIELL